MQQLLEVLQLPRDPQNPISVAISYGIRVLVLSAALYFLVRGAWASSLATILIAALMALPSFLKARYRVYVPVFLDVWMVVFIFLTLFLGNVAQLYDYIPFWDKFVHFQSGLLLGATGFRLVYSLQANWKNQLHLSPLFLAFFSVAFSLSLGVIWEFAEFFGDMIFKSAWQASLSDTMWDLIADFVGAVIMSIGGYRWMRRNKGVPFTPQPNN